MTHTHIHTGFQRFHVSWRITCLSLSLAGNHPCGSAWQNLSWTGSAQHLWTYQSYPSRFMLQVGTGNIFAQTVCQQTKQPRLCHCMSSIGIWLATKQPKGGFKKITLPHAKLTVFFEWACACSKFCCQWSGSKVHVLLSVQATNPKTHHFSMTVNSFDLAALAMQTRCKVVWQTAWRHAACNNDPCQWPITSYNTA